MNVMSTPSSLSRRLTVVALLAAAVVSAPVLFAAPPKPASSGSPPRSKPLKLPDLFEQGEKSEAEDRQIGVFRSKQPAEPQLSAQLTPEKLRRGDVATLSVTLQLPEGAHIAPQTSESEFGLPTKIGIRKLSGLTPIEDAFRPHTRPKTVTDPLTGSKQVYFEGEVTWSRKYRVADVGNRNTVSAAGAVRLQICVGKSCKPPVTKTFEASAQLVNDSATNRAAPNAGSNAPPVPPRAAPVRKRAHRGSSDGGTRSLTVAARTVEAPQNAPPTKTGSRTSTSAAGKPAENESGKQTHPFRFQVTPQRRGKPDPIQLTFELKPKDATPGDNITVSIAADLDEGWHAFALTHKKGGIGLPVEIEVQKVQGLKPVGRGWRPDKPPESRPDKFTGKTVLEHHGTVTWSRQFQVTDDVQAGGYGLSGRMTYQVCEKSCLPPKSVSFALGDVTSAVDAPPGSNAIDRETRQEVQTSASQAASGSLPMYLLFAFLGGLILNVMPCVLPVIAIKVMSFMQQAGEHRGRVFALNSVYSLGVISVFLLLATLAVTLSVGWGGLFRIAEFNLIMGLIVFAMGLSLLGVYEIPVPGFVGSAAGQQQQEGPLGAFLTGVLATVLATPCSGPFLGITLAWSVQQTPQVTYLVWGTMGLGMAFPYLVLGVFPKAIRWLPKPGDWMVRFKEFSGFVLMGTTIWVIRNLDKSQLVFSMIVMAAAGLSLWMVGNLYTHNTAPRRRWIIRTVALSVVLFAATAGSHVLESAGTSRLFTFLQRADVLAFTAGLLGLAFALWPLEPILTEQLSKAKRRTYAVLAATAAGLGIAGAYFAFGIGVELPWQPYSEARVNEELKKGNIVLVDFTADW